MSPFEASPLQGIPENIFLDLLKAYPIFEVTKKRRLELGYKNPDFLKCW